RNFVVCSFVPRKFDYHPLSIPAPYNHSNINSDEVIYYVAGNFMSRRGVDISSFTVHPAGIPLGPHPGTVEASIGKEDTEELVVVAPMPGVAADDIAIEVPAEGEMTLTCAEHGIGQERIDYLLREWSYGPYLRRVQLPCAVDASKANVAYGNGVLSISFPKA